MKDIPFDKLPRLTHFPLTQMKLTQDFGLNEPFYSQFGLKGHNGWDLRAWTGTRVIAVMDGDVYNHFGQGYGIYVRLMTDPIFDDIGIEWTYAHMSEGASVGRAKAGSFIEGARTGNTGVSTGPHLHFGPRLIKYTGDNKDSWDVLFYGNGYKGAFDPGVFYRSLSPFSLPVDRRYGLEDTWARRISFAPHFLWLIQSGHWKHIGVREFNALKYGHWDFDTVLDPAMFPIWAKMTKPAYQGRETFEG